MSSVGRGKRTRRRALLASASAAGVAFVMAGVLIAPLSASAYPSWSDVQAAKGNAAATKTQVQKITAALGSLESTAAAKSQAAITADGRYAEAETKLQAATETENALTTQLTVQKKKAALAHQEAGQLAAHLYRVGNQTSLQGQLFSGKDTSGTLYRLGALSQLTAQWQTVLDEATVASHTVSSLGAQATVAADERMKLAGEAATALASAQSAQKAADAEVASATTEQKTLYAQLATLNNTTATVEAAYRQGEAAKAAFAAAQAKKKREAEAAAAAKAPPVTTIGTGTSNGSSGGSAGGSGSTSGSGSSSGGSGGGSTSGGGLGVGVVDNPAAAQSYAASALGGYGWASSQMSCLVSLWNQESGWRTSALNPSSQSYGIPQALPATKMASAGLDWQTSYRTQINWGLGYIKAVYGSPCGAWAHEVSNNWY